MVVVELSIIYPKIYRCVFCACNFYLFVEINNVSFVPCIGIPPHISLLAEFSCVRNYLGTMMAELIQEFKQEMDARGVGGDNYFNSKAILDKMDQFGKELLEKLGEKSTSATNANFVSTSVICF